VTDNAFLPQWTSTPGEAIEDLLRQKKVSLDRLSQGLGWSALETERLLRAQTEITSKVAESLAATLGVSAHFWLSRERQYREDLVRLQATASAAAKSGWLKGLPLREMTQWGWIAPGADRVEQAQKCLDFFEVRDLDAWREVCADLSNNAALRTSRTFASGVGALVSWLRRGEVEAEAMECGQWSSGGFRAALAEVRPLTRQKQPVVFLPKLRTICAAHGVAVVVVRAPEGCRASGATRFLGPDRAVLQLSFRYLSDDHFWFTFFHEAGHLLLHGQDGRFLEGVSESQLDLEEEANQFAEEALIPVEAKAAFSLLRSNAMDVIRFALRAGISPGIVVGQLQKHGRIGHHQLNKLKRRYSWASC